MSELREKIANHFYKARHKLTGNLKSNQMLREVCQSEADKILTLLPQWINVKDRLPEIGEQVLGYHPGSGYIVIIWNKTDKNYYTHWQPLPTPPKDNP